MSHLVTFLGGWVVGVVCAIIALCALLDEGPRRG